LAMFLPLLQLVGGAEEAGSEGLGQLDFLVTAMQDLGMPLNLRFILLVLTVFFLLKGLFIYLGAYYQVLIRQYFLSNLRLALLRDFSAIQFKKYLMWDTGSVQNAFTTETSRITTAFVHYFRAMNQAVLVLVYALFAFTVDAGFALLVVTGGVLSNFLFSYFYKLSKQASRSLSAGNSKFHGLVTQFITQFKYLRATGRQLFYADKLEQTIIAIERENTKLGRYSAILEGTREPIMIIVVAAVILIQTEVMSAPLGPIMISLLFFYRALTALNGLQTSWNSFLQFSGSLDHVAQFQTDLQAAKARHTGKTEVHNFETAIQLTNVQFFYGEQSILKDINLSITKNQSIALVGESGSGKTTLVNMLAGLLPPDKGIMSVDGIDVKDLHLPSYQSRVGFIAQEPVVFNASIFDNVTFWAPRNPESIDRFTKAIKQASLLEFLEQLPDQENTLLGNNGINLSGGQRQRIAIARELYRDIDILILDEATSALDTETERHIQDSIDQLKGHYTLITVAHRLSTVKNADVIVMLDQGNIEHIAPFETLINLSPRFKKMVALQEI
jgi:ABC-type multidrug transport system fused ATPase/permease subunit